MSAIQQMMLGFGATPPAPPTCSLVHTALQDLYQSSFTYTGVNFGPASATRLIVVCFAPYSNVGGTITSATIGGVAATININTSIAWGSLMTISAIVPTGTSGTIVVNCSIVQSGSTIDVYALDGLSSSTPDFTHVDVANPLDQSITYDANTVIISHSKYNVNGTITWSGTVGVVEQHDNIYGYGAPTHSSAMLVATSSGTALTIISTHSGTPNFPGMHIIGFK